MLFWLLDNLKFEPEDTLWIGIQQELEVEYAMKARLQKEYPALDLRVVLIDFQTRGAAETLLMMLQVKSEQCTLRSLVPDQNGDRRRVAGTWPPVP